MRIHGEVSGHLRQAFYLYSFRSSVPRSSASPDPFATPAHHFQIGKAKLPSLRPWQVHSNKFLENLEWAIVVRGDRDVSPKGHNPGKSAICLLPSL
jgi:hypothetical protein